MNTRELLQKKYFPNRINKFKSIKHVLISIGKLIFFIRKKKCNFKIFFFFPWYQIGGGERVHSQIISCLNRTEICVIFTDKSNDTTFLNIYKKKATIIDLNRNFYCSKLSLIYRWVILGYLSSFVNSNNNKNSIVFGSATPLYYELLPLLNHSIKKIDLIHQFGSSIEFFSLPYVSLLTERIVITNTVYKQFQTLYQDNDLIQYFDKIKIIENGVVIPEKYPEKPRHEKLRILFVSRNSPEKRPYLIGKIAYCCAKREIDVDIVCVGDLSKAIAKEHVPYCTFLGSINDPNILTEEYRISDIILILSIFEGFPMVIMEGMARGVIPISTNVGGISEHITHGNNGFLIQNTTDEEIINQIIEHLIELGQNNKILQSMSYKCYDYAKQHFDIEHFCSEYNKLLKLNE